jgi:hypothetical protein
MKAPPLVANITQERNDAPVSRSIGALYKLSSGVSPFAGAAKSLLSNFLSENTQNGIGAPESAVKRIFRWCLAILNGRRARDGAPLRPALVGGARPSAPNAALAVCLGLIPKGWPRGGGGSRRAEKVRFASSRRAASSPAAPGASGSRLSGI